MKLHRQLQSVLFSIIPCFGLAQTDALVNGSSASAASEEVSQPGRRYNPGDQLVVRDPEEVSPEFSEKFRSSQSRNLLPNLKYWGVDGAEWGMSSGEVGAASGSTSGSLAGHSYDVTFDYEPNGALNRVNRIFLGPMAAASSGNAEAARGTRARALEQFSDIFEALTETYGFPTHPLALPSADKETGSDPFVREGRQSYAVGWHGAETVVELRLSLKEGLVLSYSRGPESRAEQLRAAAASYVEPAAAEEPEATN